MRFDFKDRSTYSGELDDIDKIFLVRPPAISNVKKYIYPLIDEAEKAGVDHIVFLSLNGAEDNPITPHHKIEKYIEKIGIPYMFLRPSFFMQNLTTTHLEEIRERDEIFVPAGDGKTNFIDVRDIGEVVALVLTENGHRNRPYELTGRGSLMYHQVADILSEHMGRRIEYSSPSILEFFIRKSGEGESLEKIIVMIGLYSIARFGRADDKTDTVEELLGREPISFERFVEDHKDCWKEKDLH